MNLKFERIFFLFEQDAVKRLNIQFVHTAGIQPGKEPLKFNMFEHFF